jgi:hypothetical protein
MRWTDIPKIAFNSFIVPTENILHKCNPLEGNALNNFSSMMFIDSFSTTVAVARYNLLIIYFSY